MADLGKAYVQIVPSAEGIKEALSKMMDEETEGMGEPTGKKIGGQIKSAIVAAGIGKAIGDIVRGAISEGSALEQSIGGVETLFKEAASEVRQNADAAFQTAGMSANDYMETVTGFSASLLQGLGGDTEKAASVADMAIRDMSDNANKFGTDIGSIQNTYQGFAKQNYTMLDNLKLGYGGTAEEMARLINETGIMNDGIEYTAKTVKDVPLDKIMEGIHQVQEEMGIAGTTAKEAADTFEGSMNSMKAAASNLLGNLALGESIKPSLDALGNSFSVFLHNNLLPMLANIIEQIPAMIGFLFTMIIQEINIASEHTDELLSGFLNLAAEIGTAILDMAPYLLEAVVNLIGSLFQSIVNFDWMEFLTELGGTIQENFSLMLGEIFGADTFTEAITGITDGAKGLIENLVSGIKEGLPRITDVTVNLISSIGTVIFDNLPMLLESGKEILLSLVQGIVDSLPSIIEAAVRILQSIVKTIVENLPQIIEVALRIVKELGAGLIRAIPGVIQAAWELINSFSQIFNTVDWGELGKNILIGIKNGLVATSSILWDAINDVAKGALDAAKNFFKIGSPSKLMADEIGKWLPEGVAVGVENNIDPLSDAVREMGEVSIDAIPETLDSDYLVSGLSTDNFPANQNISIKIDITGAEKYDEERLAQKIIQKITDELSRGDGLYA